MPQRQLLRHHLIHRDLQRGEHVPCGVHRPDRVPAAELLRENGAEGVWRWLFLSERVIHADAVQRRGVLPERDRAAPVLAG